MMKSKTVPQPSSVIAPPFALVTALRKVRLAEDAWNSRDPKRVALAYTEDSVWRNRSEFVTGRAAIRITETERRFLWPAPGPRPADHPGIPNIR
jgi:nuclear transport factor 2 (NTF2) superfamily protein